MKSFFSISFILFSVVFFIVPQKAEAQKFFMPNQSLSKSDMVRDIKVVFKTLEKHHPFLYKYADKDAFKNSLDSLLNDLPEVMTASDFFVLLSRKIYSLRHGHIMLMPGEVDNDNVIRNNGLNQFEYELFDNRIYIVNNNCSVCDIKPGTEVVSVNGKNVPDIIKKYSDAVPTEGYSEALRLNLLGHMFPLLCMFEIDRRDYFTIELKYLDSNFVCTIKSYVERKPGFSMSKLDIILNEINDQLFDSLEKDSGGVYTKIAQLYFLDETYEIAVLSLQSFTSLNSNSYKSVFKMLDSFNTKHLILDLRNNKGGFLNSAALLYSYLADTSFRFVDRPIVNSVFRFFYRPGNSLLEHVITTLALPGLLTFMSPMQRYEDKKFSFNVIESRFQNLSPLRFQGSVSVLINGGTYSAASLVAANLKHSGNNLIVGLESGGASEGTVAMRLNNKRLPNSGFQLRYGIGYIQPYAKGGEEGRGVIPDIIVEPTLQDRINGHDPELQMVISILENY